MRDANKISLLWYVCRIYQGYDFVQRVTVCTGYVNTRYIARGATVSRAVVPRKQWGHPLNPELAVDHAPLLGFGSRAHVTDLWIWWQDIQ